MCDLCDPVFASAHVGFVRQIQRKPNGEVDALLWEADPELFAMRYPDSGIVESYGDRWSEVPCIDYWVYLNIEGQARLSTEGWHEVGDVYALTGDGVADGVVIGTAMARILRVAAPSA